MCIFDKKKRNEVKVLGKPVVPLIMMGLSLSVYLISVFIFTRWAVQNLKIKSLTDDIMNLTEIIEKEDENSQDFVNDNDTPTSEPEEPEDNGGNQGSGGNTYYPNDYWDYINVPYINVDLNSLIARNSDTVGWIKVEGTKVNYPVVQTDNNEYYLSHAFNKTANAGGWIFADYRGNFTDFGRNTIIYGHNLNNKTMFGSLPSTLLSSGWQNNADNHYIKISTTNANTVWKIFSVYTIEPETYYLKTGFTDTSFQTFIDTIKERSFYNFNTEVTIEDKILTLSTCDDTGHKRMVTHAKLVKYDLK